MKLVYIKIILTILITAGIVFAQNDNQSKTDFKDINLTPAAYQQVVSTLGVQSLSSVINNTANIQQVGSNNQAYITQTLGNGTVGNLASIIQSNDGNYASITQTGNGNDNTITQAGGGNQAIINIAGSSNTSSIVQSGNNNYTIQDINSNNISYSILQQGNGNSFQRLDSGVSPKALIVSQQGNGMHLIISTNSYVK